MERRPENSTVDPAVFFISVAISVLLVLCGIFFTESLASVAKTVLDYLILTFGWVFTLATFGFLVFVLYLAFSRYGRIRLGQDDDRPEFSTAVWIAMMFSAGMGIGLMFFGVAEPVSHLANPPQGMVEAGSKEAARLAMQYSYFHWALHPWATYAVVGLAIAYFTFRKGRRNLISSAFYPILGDRVEGPIGKAIDILAIFATLFGSATSLGLGALQINGGLNYLWGFPNSTSIAILIIVVITALFTISAVTGVHRGIKYLSEINMVLAAILILFLLVVGPTLFIFNTFTESLGAYISNLVSMSFTTAAFGDAEWLATYTIFYWAWWISWTPFVGTFIARISKGRTIREFVLGVLLVPSAVSFIWFAVMGGTAIDLDFSGGEIAAAAAIDPANALFDTLNEFPLAAVMSLLAVILVALFFISGADAAAVVMAMLSSRGVLRPRTALLVLWGVLTGAAAAILLLVGGNDALQSLQQAAIIAAAPFLIVMMGICWSILKELRAEAPAVAPEPERAAIRLPGTPAPQQTSPIDPESRS